MRELPYNVEAEQLLLGAILVNNKLYNHIENIVIPESFYEPIHQKIFDAIINLKNRDIVASPITLKTRFEQDNLLKEIGGTDYLVKLATKASIVVDAKGLAKIIYDLYLKRNLITIGEKIVNNAYDNHDKEAIEQIESAEQNLFKLASYGEEDNSIDKLDTSLGQAIEKAEFAYKNQGEVHGTSTGFVDLDRLLNGMQDSDLIVLAGRPSMGKTALAVNIALNGCKFLQENNKENKSIAFFSLEMSAEQLALRLLAMESGVNSYKIRSGMLSESDFGKIINSRESLHDLPIFIDDTPAISIATLRTRARRLYRTYKIGAIFVDYLQLIRGNTNRYGDVNRVQEVSEVTQGLKAIAKELNIPVIALSQLSRLVEQREDKKPQLSDLRESGAIEQDADVVMFIFREAYYLMRKKPADGADGISEWQNKMNRVQNQSEIIIAKQRNGPIGSVKLFFDSNTTVFKDLSVREEI
ncbi:MAG: replicative DNA helicase [Rickettsiaceae bacterium H1]|nr:replicative DNA helicase [Rickettsiaceae bacterium H1]